MKIFLYTAVLLVAYLHCASSATVDTTSSPPLNPEVNTIQEVSSEDKPEGNKDLQPQETWGFGYPRYYGGWGGHRHGWGGYGYPRSYGYGGWGYPSYYGGYYGGYRGGYRWGGWGR